MRNSKIVENEKVVRNALWYGQCVQGSGYVANDAMFVVYIDIVTEFKSNNSFLYVVGTKGIKQVDEKFPRVRGNLITGITVKTSSDKDSGHMFAFCITLHSFLWGLEECLRQSTGI